MATYDPQRGFIRKIHSLESTYFRTKFECELPFFEGNSGIGVISDTDPQPIIFNSHLGKFAIVTVAKIANIDELEKRMLAANHHFAELSSGKINQTELVALLITEGRDFVEGIENVYNSVKGSCSMLLLTENGIIAARDKLGRTPIVIGKKDGAYAASSESTCFPNLDYQIDRYIGPGEIVRITADGVEQLRKPNEDMQICSFLWVYYGFPTSCYEGVNVEKVRFDSGVEMGRSDNSDVDCACGIPDSGVGMALGYAEGKGVPYHRAIAKYTPTSCYEGVNVEKVRFDSGVEMGRSDNSDVDCACGIPDSGVGMALGYAEGKGVPYHRAIAKYTPTWPRSFTPSDQSMRSLVAKMKLIPNRAMLDGKRLLFCDDSIVRGTQLRDNVKVLYDYGAKEVHMRIACPPLIYGCPFIGFTSSKSDMELITRRIIEEFEGDGSKNLDKYATTDSPEYKRLVEEIRRRFNLTSLRFNTIETLIKAIGLPKCKVCTHCFDGSSHF